jgi:hypothetical protein
MVGLSGLYVKGITFSLHQKNKNMPDLIGRRKIPPARFSSRSCSLLPFTSAVADPKVVNK